MSETDTQYYTPPEVLCEMCKQLERELAEAREQRDTLAEACRKLMKIVGAPGTNEWHETKECDSAYLAGKKALAAVKGRKP